MLEQDKCWEAVHKRDKSRDGTFFYGVLTTGVYCRPSCPSRRALLGNVRFYESATEAERNGLRPCLRCRLLIAPGPDPRARANSGSVPLHRGTER